MKLLSKNKTNFNLALSFFILLLIFCKQSSAQELKEGDLIFQTSQSEQSQAIQLATRSSYSHMGILLKKNGILSVFEAVQPVKWTPINTWINRGDKGHYVIKRLKQANKLLTVQAIKRMKEMASQYEGKNYDPYFEWSDKRMYCSELVWKIYYEALNLQIGKLQKIEEFNLSHPLVKTKIRERFGKNFPTGETVISPSEMFNSELLETIKTK